MKDRNIPRMIKSPWLPEELDGKKVRVKAVTPYGLEFEGVTGIRTSGLNPDGLMSIEIIFDYATVPVPTRSQSGFRLSEFQAKRLKRSESDEYDFVYEGILQAESEVSATKPK